MPNVIKRTDHSQRNLARSITFILFLLVAGMSWGQKGARSTKGLVEVRTTMGTFVLELYNETPVHRDNFLRLVSEGAYDSLLFHRVIPGFMVQGGDPDSRKAERGSPIDEGGPGYTLEAEIDPRLIHRRGALAAARLSDEVNPERRSSGSQFYIVQGRTYNSNELDMVVERNARMGDTLAYSTAEREVYATLGGAPHLDGAYTVFGAVVEGMEVIDAIAQQPCDNRDRPLAEIRMFMRKLE